MLVTDVSGKNHVDNLGMLVSKIRYQKYEFWSFVTFVIFMDIEMALNE